MRKGCQRALGWKEIAGKRRIIKDRKGRQGGRKAEGEEGVHGGEGGE